MVVWIRSAGAFHLRHRLLPQILIAVFIRLRSSVLRRSLALSKLGKKQITWTKNSRQGLPSGVCGIAASAAWFTSKSAEVKMSENSTAVAIKEADGYYDQNDFQKVYDTLVKHKSDTSNCELQWKIARAARDLSCLSSTSKERKKELTYEGLECAQNAVNSDDSNFSAHKNPPSGVTKAVLCRSSSATGTCQYPSPGRGKRSTSAR
ncbi:uncharacterized protein LOC134848738 [Symsagittifera roscoffensis]|uniref:uncharacterized protein LOC134848738 n=1 Tax=Symsagittifera roscoffensis TaxID=84072 RepID=UPI00307C456F